jgi:hypothetical protein
VVVLDVVDVVHHDGFDEDEDEDDDVNNLNRRRGSVIKDVILSSPLLYYTIHSIRMLFINLEREHEGVCCCLVVFG